MVIELTTEEIALVQEILALHVFGHPLNPKDERWRSINDMEVGRIGLSVLDKMRS